MVNKSITIYEPDRQLKVGFIARWRAMFSDLVKSRELIWRLFLRDFQSKYKQSILGVAWVVINSLIAVGLFAYLNSTGILHIGSTGVPYVAFAIIGLTVWNLFANAIVAGTTSVLGAGPMITKINFPKISLVFASMGQSLVEFGVRLVLVGVILMIFHVVPSWTVIFFPLAVIPLMLFTAGLAIALSLLAGVFRDIANGINLVTTFLMFLTPVFYPVPKAGILAKLFAWNPLAQLVIGPRDLVIYGGLSNKNGFFISSIFALIIFLVAWHIFHLAETKIAERI